MLSPTCPVPGTGGVPAPRVSQSPSPLTADTPLLPQRYPVPGASRPHPGAAAVSVEMASPKPAPPEPGVSMEMPYPARHNLSRRFCRDAVVGTPAPQRGHSRGRGWPGPSAARGCLWCHPPLLTARWQRWDTDTCGSEHPGGSVASPVTLQSENPLPGLCCHIQGLREMAGPCPYPAAWRGKGEIPVSPMTVSQLPRCSSHSDTSGWDVGDTRWEAGTVLHSCTGGSGTQPQTAASQSWGTPAGVPAQPARQKPPGGDMTGPKGQD